MTTGDYNISAGHAHAMDDPSMLDNYTGPCEFAVVGLDGFQWYTGTLVGPASTPGERRWAIEHVGLTLTRAASHIAIPIQAAVRVRHLRTYHDSEIIPPTCSVLTTMSPADVVTTHEPSPSAGTDDTHTLNRASNAR